MLGCLRHQSQLDHLITVFSGKTAKLDPEVRTILRMGIFQLRYLDRIPAHAAVAESVELVKQARKRSATGFVNAVLRKVHRNPIAWPDRATELNLPPWLLAHWDAHYGPDAATRMAHPKVAMVKISTGSDPIHTPMNLPISQDLIKTLESVRGPAVKIPNTGASGAQGKMEETIGVKSINIPIANYDNHQHSANENIRIQNLWDAIELMAALLRM